MSSGFDRVAGIYRACEYATLGRTLESVRFHFLPKIASCRNALILGEGDGRFLAKLLQAQPAIRVTVVDSSDAMLQLARKRAGTEAWRVNFFRRDIRAWQPDGNFDLIVTHFVLDCMTTAEVADIVGKALPHMSTEAVWCHSDFTVPTRGATRLAAAAYIRALYAAFAVLTGLRVKNLPDTAAVFLAAGLSVYERKCFLRGLLTTELLERMPRNPGTPPESSV